ncbi:MAG: ATP-binding cassette domain-containing protein [Actinomycetota bacterium]|nr:ATP-binding cassette domain-containing protein [Actinomycetota bacterium]
MISVEGLSVAYGGRLAVGDVSFAVAPGQVLGLIGPNGAGKTSVLNGCSGLVTASGSVSVGGRALRGGLAARARAGLGRTFQRPAVFGSLTVSDDVGLGGPASQALEVCGLTDLRNTRCSALTPGQRRRVELARVLAGNFTAALLDEPFAGLDDREKQDLRQVLRVLAEGRAVVLVEHDLSVVADVCDEVLVLDRGQVLTSGPPLATLASDAVREAYLGVS